MTASTTVTATGNVTGGNLTTAGITSTGSLTASTTVTATGNVTGGNLVTAGQLIATGNVAGGNLVTAGQLIATGNVTGGNLTTAGITSTGSLLVSGNTIISTSLAVGATTPSSTAGEIRATNAITAFYSDRRLKTNVQQIQHALDKVEQLSGVVYTQNKLAETFGYTDYSQQVGVFAQDVKEVQPEAVKLAPFDLDENGQSKSGENYLTVQYEKLVPLLIESIKELRKEINLIKNQLDSKGNNGANNS